MAKQGDKGVISGNAVVLWDGITRPDTNDSGSIVHSLKVAMIGNAPEVQELIELATNELNTGEFKGAMPQGGLWPLQNVPAQKFEGRLPGYVEFNTKTYRGAPQVYDANGQEIAAMVYSSMLYPGAIVRVLVHPYTYNNKSKGIAFGLDGIQIIDPTAPRLPVSGGVDAGAAFASVPAQGAPPAGYPPAGAPPAGYPPAGAPPAGYPPAGAPPAGYPPAGAPPAGYPPAGAPPAGYPPAGHPPAGYPPAGAPGTVTPAHDFLNPGQPQLGTVNFRDDIPY